MTALESDVGDIQGGTTQEGIHMGVMAGTLDELRRIYLPCTRVNKGYMSQRRGCGGCLRPSMVLCYPLQERVEAEKPVPHVGTFWGGWSQWRNRLPHEA
jgi:hypothetical protein